ncbi:ABC transporter permease subunit [Paracoccus sp. TK19116]|uniref:ABC transporter permease subunit n=1 Tax=Paracoccus albicereus TaxID=2922394 RepID=A0ABT1MUQ7_9RHOB|nr:ABC transporter permease subunit [Paracoccus albicereus]MCQ0972017.1 ABC transporter permease subunit [Paracoccus albicereus]
MTTAVGTIAQPLRSGLGSAFGVILILLAWDLAARATAGSFVLAAPAEVLNWLVANRGLMGRALAETLANAAAGFVIGNLAAILLAVVALAWPRAERAVMNLALLIFCLPLVATGPILRVLLGPGDGPQIWLAALAVYYTTLVPLMVGLRAAPASWLDLVRIYGRGRWTEIVRVRARAALPYLFAGLQIAAPAAFLGAMVGEFTGAERGMGVLTVRFIRAMDVPAIWALACVAALVSILVFAAIGWLARFVLDEKPPVIIAPAQAVGALGVTARMLRTLTLAVLALALWWAVIQIAQLNPFFAKGPDDVARALLSAPDAAETRARLGTALVETAVYVVPGWAAGLGLGAAIAIVLILFPPIAAVAMPVAVALRAIPIVTTAPLIVLVLGRGAVGTISLVAVMVFFPSLVACLHGLRQAPGQIMDVFDSYAAGPVSRLIHVRIPAMLPAFFASARMSVPAAILAVTVVEWLATGRGIGSLMALSASLSEYDMLWSAIMATAVLAVLFHAGVSALERVVLARTAPEQVG